MRNNEKVYSRPNRSWTYFLLCILSHTISFLVDLFVRQSVKYFDNFGVIYDGDVMYLSSLHLALHSYSIKICVCSKKPCTLVFCWYFDLLMPSQTEQNDSISRGKFLSKWMFMTSNICFVSMFWNARTPQAYKRTKITLETPLTLYELVCIWVDEIGLGPDPSLAEIRNSRSNLGRTWSGVCWRLIWWGGPVDITSGYSGPVAHFGGGRSPWRWKLTVWSSQVVDP